MNEPRIITASQRAARWRGLGDVVASATKLVGVIPCGGCRERQEKLNRLVPFRPEVISLPNGKNTTNPLP